MTKKTDPSIGREMVRRLKRFSESLAKTDSLVTRFTCRTVKISLRPKVYGAKRVKDTRHLLRASQSIFAQFLGVSPSTVRDWEQGLKPPSGAACRIMDEIRRNPEYFLSRLIELSSTVSAK
jgi:putative transcriptional regulator